MSNLRLEMEEQGNGLRLEIAGKDRHVQELTSSLAEMREKMAEVESSSQMAAHRIGT